MIASTIAVVLIGIAQLYLGILYFSYLIGGYAAGAVWLSACVTGIKMRDVSGLRSVRDGRFD